MGLRSAGVPIHPVTGCRQKTIKWTRSDTVFARSFTEKNAFLSIANGICGLKNHANNGQKPREAPEPFCQ
jgi:hypothetical protein